MRVLFGDFIFDSETRALTRGDATVRLSTKAFLLLETLLAEAPRAVKKDDLYRRLWGETFVEEANLPNLISEIRAALGETSKGATLIKTVHSFGYAFSGAITRAAPSDDQRMSQYALLWRRRELALHQGKNIVGRCDDADVVIGSGAVSRRHAVISVSSDGVTIEDLGSKNGTFVANERLVAARRLEEGAEIRFGMVEVTLRRNDSGASTMTAME